MMALEEFGFANTGIEASHFEKESVAIHLGVEPNRIDLITSILGVNNEELFQNIKKVSIDDCQLNIISFEHLIKSKESSKRHKDLADAEALRERNNELRKLYEGDGEKGRGLSLNTGE